MTANHSPGQVCHNWVEIMDDCIRIGQELSLPHKLQCPSPWLGGASSVGLAGKVSFKSFYLKMPIYASPPRGVNNYVDQSERLTAHGALNVSHPGVSSSLNLSWPMIFVYLYLNQLKGLTVISIVSARLQSSLPAMSTAVNEGRRIDCNGCNSDSAPFAFSFHWLFLVSQ